MRADKVDKIKFIIVTILIIFLLFILFALTQKKPALKSYEVKEENVYTLLEISDEDFLKKIMFGKDSEIEQMINMGANIKAVDATGRNALSIGAMFNGKPEVARILKKAGAEVNSKDINGYTPLMLSSISGSNAYPYFKELIKLGADVNLKTNSEATTLSVVAGSNSDERVIELLLKNGAKVNEKNKDGSRAIMVAAKITTNPKVIETLIKYGAKTDKKYLGKSVYEIALGNPALRKDKKLMDKLKKNS